MLGVIIISEMNPESGGSAQEFEEESDPIFGTGHRVCPTPQLPFRAIEGEEEGGEKKGRSPSSGQRQSVFEEKGAPCESSK